MMNSSTSNSRAKPTANTQPWYRNSWDLIGVVAAIALLEIGLQVSIEKFNLREVAAFKQEDGLALRADTIDTSVAKAEKADDLNVALIGSSMLNDIETEQLSEQLASSPVEKFTLIGANSRGSALVLEHIVLPNLQTNWVVYMVSPHDINSLSPVEERNESIPGIDAYADNRFVYKFSRQLETKLYLFRYRRPIVQSLPSIGSIRTIIENRLSPPEPAVEVPYEFATYESFETAARFQGDLEHIHQLAQENGAQLAVLAVPTNPADDITYDEFQKGAENWLTSLQMFAAKRDITIINGFELLDSPSQYRDTHHLNEEGARVVTQALAEALKANTDEQ